RDRMRLRPIRTGDGHAADSCAHRPQSAQSEGIPAAFHAAGVATEIQMKNYRPVMSFDETVAREFTGMRRGDEDAAVAFLAPLAGEDPALELAIGSGRIALPL